TEAIFDAHQCIPSVLLELEEENAACFGTSRGVSVVHQPGTWMHEFGEQFEERSVFIIQPILPSKISHSGRLCFVRKVILGEQPFESLDFLFENLDGTRRFWVRQVDQSFQHLNPIRDSLCFPCAKVLVRVEDSTQAMIEFIHTSSSQGDDRDRSVWL